MNENTSEVKPVVCTVCTKRFATVAESMGHPCMSGPTIAGDVPVTEYMVNGQTYQPATVFGADTFASLRDRGYRQGLAWHEACAIAAWIIAHHPEEAKNVLENCYGRLKDEAWYSKDLKVYWDHYASQPSHPRY